MNIKHRKDTMSVSVYEDEATASISTADIYKDAAVFLESRGKNDGNNVK